MLDNELWQVLGRVSGFLVVGGKVAHRTTLGRRIHRPTAVLSCLHCFLDGYTAMATQFTRALLEESLEDIVQNSYACNKIVAQATLEGLIRSSAGVCSSAELKPGKGQVS